MLKGKTLTKTEALAKQKHVLAHGYIKQEVKLERGGDAFSSVKRERAGSKEHVRAQQQEKQSRRKIDRYSAWVSINVAGLG